MVHQKDLLAIVDEQEKVIVELFLSLKNGGEIDFLKMSDILFQWSKKWIRQ